MDLQKIIPDRFIHYQWQQPEGSPYDPANGCPFPKSRHAWGSIGHAGEVIPNGAAVALVPLQPDGTRGVLTIWADWFQGVGGGNNFIEIALLDGAGPDAVPPLFVQNPTNCLAGRCYAVTNAVESSTTVAIKVATMALEPMLNIAGFDAKFYRLGGKILYNFARADLGNGTVTILSPAPWRTIQLAQLGGVWGNIGPDAFEEHEGTYRPEFLAGVRPAPWLVIGNAWAGRGEHHTIIG